MWNSTSSKTRNFNRKRSAVDPSGRTSTPSPKTSYITKCLSSFLRQPWMETETSGSLNQEVSVAAGRSSYLTTMVTSANTLWMVCKFSILHSPSLETRNHKMRKAHGPKRHGWFKNTLKTLFWYSSVNLTSESGWWWPRGTHSKCTGTASLTSAFRARTMTQRK